MATPLPEWLESSLPSAGEILRRLRLLIPEQSDPRGWARRQIAAKAVFVFLYGYAIEGEDRWLRPTAVTDMTDRQARRLDRRDRELWLETVQGRHRPRTVRGRWYGENTRESIRDETLRLFVELGVVVERPGLATTSPKPRYALRRSFLALCEPGLSGDRLRAAIDRWRRDHLSPAALARIALERQGAAPSGTGVLVTLPSGEVRRLAPGPSSRLIKAAVEEFARRFLVRPAVVLLSESADKITYRDEAVLRAIRLHIDPRVALPDAVLVDIGVKPTLLVFVECVVTDGAVDERRRAQLMEIATASGYQPGDCAFVTVFHDRARSPFRTTATSLAWGSFAWFETEPSRLVCFHDGEERPARSLASWLRPRSR